MKPFARPGRVSIFLFAACLVLLAPFLGMRMIGPGEIFARGTMESVIFWDMRVPRVVTAFFAGAALSVCGMVFQAVFRNALATPFTLGVSSGASLGAAVYMWLDFGFVLLGIPGVALFAFAGSMISIAMVYGLSRIAGRMSTAGMLLAGVAISFFFSSLILFGQYMSDFTDSFRVLRWLMGGVVVTGYDEVRELAPFIAAGMLIICSCAHELNLLATGEEFAASRGVDTTRCLWVLFVVTSVMVGVVVSICGPIGFVGMMAPHICRMLVGTDHRILTPAAFVFGGVFLVCSDVLSRMLIAPAELPVGILTALLGGPFFLWLLMRQQTS